MHSGGGQKEKWSMIYIHAPIHEAKLIFYNKFGHNPNRVTCTCCGDDYSISEEKDLKQLTGSHRNCNYDENGNTYIEEQKCNRGYGVYQTLEEYKKSKDVLFIDIKDILPEWREGEIPEQGYVWKD
jgi:hypothetical protein